MGSSADIFCCFINNHFAFIEYRHLPSRIAGKIDTVALKEKLSQSNVIKSSDWRNMSLANVYALCAAHEAVQDAAWTPEREEDPSRAGTSIATGMAGIIEISEAAISLHEQAAGKNENSSQGLKGISPYFVPKILPNLSCGLLSIKYNLKVSTSVFKI